MHLLIFLNILVLFGDETFGASLSGDYDNWKKNFYNEFNKDSYIKSDMYKVAYKKAQKVAERYQVYNDSEKKAAIKIVNLFTQEHDKRQDLEIYSNVNKQLRNPSHCKGNVWLEYAGLLNRGISTLCPNDPEKCIYKKVYRGAKHCTEVANCDDNLEEKKTVLFKGFTPTSKDPNIAYHKFMRGKDNKRNGYFFYIEDIIKGLYVENFTQSEGEKEVLIPSNTAFRISEILKSSKSVKERRKINSRLQDHGVTDLIKGVNAKVYVELKQGQDRNQGVVCKCGLTFPNLSLVMVIVVMVKVIL